MRIPASELKDVLNKVRQAAAVRPTIEVLSHIAFDAGSGICYCSDLEKTITHGLPGLDFSGCVSARLLVDLIGTAPASEMVTLEMDGEKLRVEFGAYHGNINTLPLDQMPLIPEMDDEWKTIPPMPFLKHIKDVVIAAEMKEENRPVLTGMYLCSSGGMSTADGFRLATTGYEFDKGMIIPAKTMALLPGLFADASEIRFQYSERGERVAFTDGTVTVYSQVIEGNYPNIDQIIPKCANLVTFLAADALRALKTVLVLADDTSLVNVARDGDHIIVSASDPQTGNAAASFPAQGDTFETFALNGKFLQDALQTMGTIEMGTSGPARPILLREGELRHVIMPMMGRG